MRGVAERRILVMLFQLVRTTKDQANVRPGITVTNALSRESRDQVVLSLGPGWSIYSQGLAQPWSVVLMRLSNTSRKQRLP